MFKWLLRGRLRARIESDILDARSMLSAMKLKLHKEGAEATVVYGEGVGAVAGLLAKRFQISVPAALEAKGLDWRQLSDAADDLSEALAGRSALLHSEVQAVRAIGHGHVFGSLVLYHLYRLRFLTTQAPPEQQPEARAQADRIAEFARIMAEIAVGFRNPDEATK